MLVELARRGTVFRHVRSCRLQVLKDEEEVAGCSFSVLWLAVGHG